MTYQGPWNAQYVESLYEQWKEDPDSLEKDWQAFFRGFELASTQDVQPEDSETALKQSRVEALIYRYRDIGHLLSCLDPLAACPSSHPLLEPGAFGLDETDMNRTYYFRGYPGENRSMALSDIIDHLKRTYCRDAGVEYMHLQDPEERKWLRDRIESPGDASSADLEEKLRILQKLCESAAFEQFIHRKYLGQKRFSGEGADAMIPMIDALISHAADNHECGKIVMGMAHRGRLNVQVNVLGKLYEDIFREFENQYNPDVNVGAGDVKYHSGFDGEVKTRGSNAVNVILAHNPSHLESVDPVVQGIARAHQEENGQSGVLPLLLHGDAAFSGQGIVAETLSMSGIDGYATGGTIHLVINNQIGYTALPEDLRSTRYATDIAKMLMVPIFHIHGESPEAAVEIIRLAVDYRMAFAKDVVIDLVCFRKYGHNEGDEPYFTQPLMYERIKNRPSLHALYAGELREAGIIDEAGVEKIRQDIDECLQTAYDKAVGEKKAGQAKPLKTKSVKSSGKKRGVDTTVKSSRLKSLSETINTMPEAFRLHRKLERLFQNRHEAVEKGTGIDWANAELLAFASIVQDGLSIRLSGQDSQRGTFSQRHSVVFDTETNESHIPLNSIENGQGLFYPINSLLSEAGVLGFEYGYSLVKKEGLTIWEAQFGDFANNAQAVIDLYVAAGETRWGRESGLVMLLPHGYEGQGPDHSSARIERFLQLAADDNICVCLPTTPAQYFHLLRRQVQNPARKPLVIMTPKSLLRHPEAVSNLEILSTGEFSEVIDDPNAPKKPKKVIFVSGKLFYELGKATEENKREDIALVRVEQLYPFPEKSLSAILDSYKGCDSWVWAQEEPENMGAWRFMAPLFEKVFSLRLDYRGRKASASTATGYHHVFVEEQKSLVADALK